MQQLLEDLLIDSEDFQLLEKSLVRFCPFDALGIINAEIRHGNFLASVCDPYRAHRFGSAFLREFLDGIIASLGDGGSPSRLLLQLDDLSDVSVHREWNNIDIVIELRALKTVIAFELKVGASESAGQLRKYRQSVEQQWPSPEWRHLLLFLTPSGDEPSESEWQALDYSIVVSAVERMLSKFVDGDDLARSMLKSYGDMLGRNHMEHDELDDLAQRIWSRHKEVLKFLMERQPDELAGIGPAILKDAQQFAEDASYEGFDLEPDKSSSTYIRFGIKQWDQIPALISGGNNISNHNRLLLIQVVCRPDAVRLQILIGPGDQETRVAIYEAAPRKMRKLSDQFTALVSKKVLDPREIGDDEQESAIQTVAQSLKSFIKDEVIPLHSVVKNLGGLG